MCKVLGTGTCGLCARSFVQVLWFVSNAIGIGPVFGARSLVLVPVVCVQGPWYR